MSERRRIGIDLGGTKIEGAAFEGRVERGRVRVPTPQGDYDGTLRVIAELVHELDGGDKPATIGIGTPGAVSPATGRIKNANSTCLNGRPLVEDLERLLQRPIRIANDADCFALSEAIDGAGRDADTVFGVILGTGVGGGIVVGRRLLTGPNAIAGEWGHNPLPRPTAEETPGPACYCGRRGCLETFLSGPALARDHREATGQELTGEEVVARGDTQDPGALETLGRYEDRLARALASIINVLDPHVIVLGGGLSKISRLYEQVPRAWVHHVFSDRVDTRLVPPVHGDAGGVRGAAWLWSDDT